MLHMSDFIIELVDQAKEFIESLDHIAYAKSMKSINLFYTYGGDLGYPHTKKIAKSLYELRIPGHPAVRLFFTTKDNRIILFYGFLKKTNKLPKKELTMALKLLRELVG